MQTSHSTRSADLGVLNWFYLVLENTMCWTLEYQMIQFPQNFEFSLSCEGVLPQCQCEGLKHVNQVEMCDLYIKIINSHGINICTLNYTSSIEAICTGSSYFLILLFYNTTDWFSGRQANQLFFVCLFCAEKQNPCDGGFLCFLTMTIGYFTLADAAGASLLRLPELSQAGWSACTRSSPEF